MKYPLVLLPGTGCNGLLWSRMLPFLPKEVKPIMPNLLSCTTQQAMIQRINELPYKKFGLLGFSMGGYLARHFTAAYPERVSHLILLCTSGQEKQMSNTQIERSLDHLTDEAYLAQMINKNKPEKKQELYQLLSTMLTEVGKDNIRRQMYATQKRHPVINQSPILSIPRLLVAAGQDQLVPQSHSKDLANTLQSPLVLIDSGHMLPLEAPEELGLVLQNWINKQFLNARQKSLSNDETPRDDSSFRCR